MPATYSQRAINPDAEEHEIVASMRAEGLAPYRWSNAPRDTYAPHSHAYHKVLYCVRGSIRFVLTRENRSIDLQAGDRMDLEPHTEHSAFVGPDGVTCLEAQH